MNRYRKVGPTSKLVKSKRICVTSSEYLLNVTAHDSLSVLGSGKSGFVNHPITADDWLSHARRPETNVI